MGPVHQDAHRFAPAAPHEEHVYGACSPGWHSAADHRTAVEQWVAFMQEAGIERVCCLLSLPPGEADERVVVHGLAGLGRTGQVLAAWLVAHHEYRPHEAVDTVREMGRDPAVAIEGGDATHHELLDMLGEFRP
jgi:hypothetical protein